MLIASYYTFKHGSFNNYTKDKKAYCQPVKAKEGELCKVWDTNDNKCIQGITQKGVCDTRFKIDTLPVSLWILGLLLLCIGIILKY